MIGKPNERSGEVPTAFVVRQPNVEVSEQEIISYVAGLYFLPTKNSLYLGIA